jgi:hypothetical protein
MKKWALHFLIFMMSLMSSFLTRAYENHLSGARSAALANASVALAGSEAVFHNPALLTCEQKLSLTISYESRFLLKELSLMAAGIAIPVHSGSFGGNYVQFGSGAYRENRLSLMYAKKLGKHFSSAIGFDYLSERLPENSKPFSALSVDIGVAAGTPGKLMIGLHIFNPVRVKLELPGGKVTIPSHIRLGNTWKVTDWLLFCSELDFIGVKPAGIHTGLEFNPFPEISVRVGVSGCPAQISAGTGFRMGRITFNIAFSHHGNLGFTPTAGISFVP